MVIFVAGGGAGVGLVVTLMLELMIGGGGAW